MVEDCSQQEERLRRSEYTIARRGRRACPRSVRPGSSVPAAAAQTARVVRPFQLAPRADCLALEMQHDHLGQDLPVAAVPLKGELNVGAGRVTMLKRIMTQVIAVFGHRRAMEQLEETDRHITMNLRHPARADLELGVKPVAAFVGMIIPVPRRIASVAAIRPSPSGCSGPRHKSSAHRHAPSRHIFGTSCGSTMSASRWRTQS